MRERTDTWAWESRTKRHGERGREGSKARAQHRVSERERQDGSQRGRAAVAGHNAVRAQQLGKAAARERGQQ